jgi:hypothetical protein
MKRLLAAVLMLWGATSVAAGPGRPGAGPPPPRVRFETPKVAGKLKAAVVVAKLWESEALVLRCYGDALARKTAGDESLSAAFTIPGAGGVAAFKVTGAKDLTLVTCVAGELDKLQFPAPSSHRPVKVTAKIRLEIHYDPHPAG